MGCLQSKPASKVLGDHKKPEQPRQNRVTAESSSQQRKHNGHESTPEEGIPNSRVSARHQNPEQRRQSIGTDEISRYRGRHNAPEPGLEEGMSCFNICLRIELFKNNFCTYDK
jgi:hypothetical protein